MSDLDEIRKQALAIDRASPVDVPTIALPTSEVLAMIKEIDRLRPLYSQASEALHRQTGKIATLERERDALKAEIARRVRLTIDQAMTEMVDERCRLAEGVVGDLSLVIDRMREALEFYADPDSWRSCSIGDGDDYDEEVFAIDADDVEDHVYQGDTVSGSLVPSGGKRARAALSSGVKARG